MVSNLNISSKEARKISTSTTPSNLVINKFPNREVYEKIKAKGSLGKDDVNVLEDYGYMLTETDKTEIAGKVIADGTEFTLSDFPTALKNPHALTFTGAATGTYDGSAPLTITIPRVAPVGALEPVDLPSGNEGKSWTKIIDVEITEATDSFSKNGLNNCTEIYAVWGGIQNATSTNSVLVLKINDVMVNNSFVLNQRSGSSVYGYSTAKYNGQVWLTMRSGGAISSENISPHSFVSPYNTIANVGKATKIKMTILNSTYAPVSGKLEVWAR